MVQLRQDHGLPEEADATEASEQQEDEIDLLELFFHLLENLRYIVLATIVGAVLAGMVSFFAMAPQYESTAKLYVVNSSDSVLNLSDLQIGAYLASDYLEVFSTWEVQERVLTNLSLGYSYRQLHEMLTVKNPSNTRILYITVRSTDPAEAALIANEYASVVREYISQTMSTEMPNILSTALEPTAPIGPNKTRNILLGAILGALLAAGVLVVMFMLDDKIKSSDDIMKYAGIPTLAIVPTMKDTGALKHPTPAARQRKR